MCGGNPFRSIFRAVQTVQPHPAIRDSIIHGRTPLQPLVAEKLTCPSCSAEVDVRFSWCPSCGAALKPQPCVYCEVTLSPEDTACPACGAPRARRTV